jgi:endoglucanase
MMMKLKIYCGALFLAAMMGAVLLPAITFAQTPVSQNGALKVSGNKILNKNNQAVSFSGPSYFWSNTGWGGERFYNSGTVNYFRSNWNAGIVRAAMGVDESGGYLWDASNKTRAKAIIDAAIANGMYVIIDWHSHKAENYRQQAIDFFREMAQTYGAYDNIIYEIYNEPLAVSWSATIKPYAQAVIGAIRAVDPDNIIIVGTPNWSQDVDAASLDPITGYSNIAYTLHFYAATHKQYLRDKANTALSRGLALFVTEWGTCEASGNGFVDVGSTNEWVTFMKANGISNCNWSVNDKNESASILKSGASATGGWNDSNLTTSGLLVKSIVQNWGGNPPQPCSSVSLPGTIQAESYCSMQGVQLESTSDAGGGQNVGWIDLNDWMAYSVNVPSAGSYTVSYRVASLNGGGRIQLEKQGGGVNYGTVNVPSTGGWQNWQTITQTVQLPAGQLNLAILALAGGFNLNWFSITGGGGGFSLTVQSENFVLMSGVQTENTTDSGGGLNVGWIDNNDWMKYTSINIPTTGAYLVEYRVSSPTNTGKLTLDLNAGAIVLGSMNIPNTGGWQNWQTISHTVNINAGTYDFGVFSNVGGWNINWFRISRPAGGGGRVATEDLEASIDLFPNPAEHYLLIGGLSENVKDVVICDLAGREMIRAFPDKKTEVRIDIQQLAKGVHFVRIHSGSGVVTKRFSKK